MIHLTQGEKILAVLHRHWIVIFWKFLLGAVLVLLPAAIAPIALSLNLNTENLALYIAFFGVLYLMAVVLLIFIFWVDYYLDVWIITSERIIDIEQKGLFNREISEFMLDKVQDITVEVPNMLATFLRYGNIVVQTAGERSFTIKQIPNLYEAKNLILDYAKKQNVRTLQMGAD